MEKKILYMIIILIIPLLLSRKYVSTTLHKCELNLIYKFWKLTNYWQGLMSWRIYRGISIRHNWGPFCAVWRYFFTNNISYCTDNIKCDSASNVPNCSLNNGVSIVQNLLSNSQTLPQCYFHLLQKRCPSIWVLTNAISKNLPSSGTEWLLIMTFINPLIYMWSNLKKRKYHTVRAVWKYHWNRRNRVQSDTLTHIYLTPYTHIPDP